MGGEPDAGRRLRDWAFQAGFAEVTLLGVGVVLRGPGRPRLVEPDLGRADPYVRPRRARTCPRCGPDGARRPGGSLAGVGRAVGCLVRGAARRGHRDRLSRAEFSMSRLPGLEQARSAWFAEARSFVPFRHELCGEAIATLPATLEVSMAPYQSSVASRIHRYRTLISTPQKPTAPARYGRTVPTGGAGRSDGASAPAGPDRRASPRPGRRARPALRPVPHRRRRPAPGGPDRPDRGGPAVRPGQGRLRRVRGADHQRCDQATLPRPRLAGPAAAIHPGAVDPDPRSLAGPGPAARCRAEHRRPRARAERQPAHRVGGQGRRCRLHRRRACCPTTPVCARPKRRPTSIERKRNWSSTR